MCPCQPGFTRKVRSGKAGDRFVMLFDEGRGSDPWSKARSYLGCGGVNRSGVGGQLHGRNVKVCCMYICKSLKWSPR